MIKRLILTTLFLLMLTTATYAAFGMYRVDQIPEQDIIYLQRGWSFNISECFTDTKLDLSQKRIDNKWHVYIADDQITFVEFSGDDNKIICREDQKIVINDDNVEVTYYDENSL